MWPKFGNCSISMRKAIKTSILWGFDKKSRAFFDGWSWFKLNNLGLALGTKLKFYTRVAKVLKLKVKILGGLIPKFVEVTGEKLVGGLFAPLPPILNGVKGGCLQI